MKILKLLTFQRGYQFSRGYLEGTLNAKAGTTVDWYPLKSVQTRGLSLEQIEPLLCDKS